MKDMLHRRRFRTTPAVLLKLILPANSLSSGQWSANPVESPAAEFLYHLRWVTAAHAAGSVGAVSGRKTAKVF